MTFFDLVSPPYLRGSARSCIKVDTLSTLRCVQSPNMTWSWKLARIAGIDIYVHVTFLMVIVWIGVIHWSQNETLGAVIEGVGFILALFACIVLHEYGHALTARRYGIRTRDITLLPIGGLARLERMPDVPAQELWVALAGPAVNVIIAAVLFIWLQASGSWQPLDSVDVASGAFAQRILLANVFLAGFNLLPAFPMDGGRALRALLATRMDTREPPSVQRRLVKAWRSYSRSSVSKAIRCSFLSRCSSGLAPGRRRAWFR